ncbi:DUF4279 domain-containing protein [Paraburkholderia sp. BL25I1N1]|uniref:DUF4279 domain-containing protein n=1 Tax=Paraburkholderia sp. BL25I1N1 TaxID=1938804 RepID=UPI000D051AD3|nr:DUF4279 domain-containing protein [Paraburkholderia sp. BL25I1N1]PRY03817.1 uncharacterized protein DUF4279 [Paraburkholderia sp. BL25I1N1]
MPHALAHATFIISGDSVSPEFWTSYFSVQPSRAITKGQRYQLPSGKLSPRPGKFGLWAVESKAAVRSNYLGPHLQYLKNYLFLPRDDLHELVRKQGGKMAVWCYWMNETGDRTPDVPADIRAMMEAMGGTIEIDEYR